MTSTPRTEQTWGSLRTILDSLAGRAWRGTPADLAGRFLVQAGGLAKGTSPESLRETLTGLYSHARRWAPGLDVPFFVPPVRIGMLDGQQVGEFRVDGESYASVTVSAHHVGDTNAVLMILAHEACHDILRQSRLNHEGDVELDEITTDLAMFICGFGELVLRGHSRVDRSKGRGARVHFGSLSSQRYQGAYTHVLALRATQRLPGGFDGAKPIDIGAPAPQEVSALLAEMLDAASLSLEMPAPLKHAEPPLPSPRPASRRPWQRRAVPAPSNRPELPSRAARKGMSEAFEWMQLGEKMARRQGLPAWIPVPEGQSEQIAEEELRAELCRQWVNDFLLGSADGKSGVWRKANAALVSSLESFVDKGPLWDKAHAAFAENDHARAITRLKRITVMDPDDHAARLDLACALATTGDYPEALKAFKATKKTFEGDPDYHVDVGHVHLALNDRDSALNEMALALEADPDCQAALDAMAQMGILAVAEYLSGRHAEAAAKAEEKARAAALAKAEEKARAEALAKIKRATIDIDTETPPRAPDGFDSPKVAFGQLDTSRLPDLSDRQKQQVFERGKKLLTEEAAKGGEKALTGGPAQGKTLAGATEEDRILALVDLEPARPAEAKVLPAAASDEALARTKEKARAEAAARAEKVRAEAAARAEKVRAEAAARAEKIRAEAAARAEKVLAEAAAEAEKILAEAEEIARGDGLARTKEKVARAKEPATKRPPPPRRRRKPAG